MKKPHKAPIRKRRFGAAVLTLAFAVLIFIFSHIPAASYPSHPGFLNYIAHFSEYFVLGALLVLAFTGGKLKTWQILLLAILIASAYAVSDELHQYFIPGRLCDPVDWAVDTLGASVGAFVCAFVLKRVDTRKRSS